MTDPYQITRAYLQYLGLNLVNANEVMEEIERLRAELADMKAKHTTEVANGVELAGRLADAEKECDGLLDERDTAIAAAQDKHSIRAARNEELKAERDEFETQLMNAHKLVADGMKREAALRGALVRLCNSWAEGTERENYEAMKEAKAAISSDAGRDYISREQVKPLVDLLGICLNDTVLGAGTIRAELEDAIKHARTLGL